MSEIDNLIKGTEGRDGDDKKFQEDLEALKNIKDNDKDGDKKEEDEEDGESEDESKDEDKE